MSGTISRRRLPAGLAALGAGAASSRSARADTAALEAAAPSWSPDGKSIAFLGRSGKDAERYNTSNVFVMEARAGAALNLAFTDVRQMDEIENHRQQQKDHAKCEVRHLHRIRAVRAGLGKVLENEKAADQRPDRGADGIETLRQIQPARGGSLRAEDRDVRIGRDLEHG